MCLQDPHLPQGSCTGGPKLCKAAMSRCVGPKAALNPGNGAFGFAKGFVVNLAKGETPAEEGPVEDKVFIKKKIFIKI